MASRIDSSQNRNLYVGTGTEVAVNDGNAIVAGNVGIGTTGPQAKLHVYDTAIPSSGDIITNKIYSVGDVTANSNTRTGLDVETTRTGWYNSDSTSGNFKISINNRIGASTLIGVKSLATIDVNNIYSGVSAQGSLIALYGRVTTTFTTGSSPVATAYGLRIDAPEVATNSEIVTYYGAYINGGSVSGTLTNKYALVTEAEAGNVGIGTTSPEEKLKVIGSVLISNNEFYKVENTTGTNYKIAGLTNGNMIQIGAIDYTSAGTIFAGGDNVSITTGGASGSTRIKIASSGNVGIGTTSIDASSPKLEVSGSIMSTSSSLTAAPTTASVVMDYHSPNNAGRIMAGSGGSWNKNLSLVPYGGNVGIGTTSPNAKLVVKGSGLVSQDFFHIEDSGGIRMLEVTSDGAGNSNLQVKDTAGATKSLINSAGNSYFNGGNVGIGTTSPSTKLHVDSSTAFSLTSVAGDTLFLSDDTNPSALNGVGASIGFSGPQEVQRQAAIAALRTGSDHDHIGLAFYTHPGTSNDETIVEQMRITDSGNVGIGTTSPAAKLNVVDSTALTAQFSGYSFASAANNARAASGSLRLGDGSGSTGLLIDYTDQGQTLALIKNLYTVNVLSELRLQSPFISLYTGTTAAEKMRITPAGGISFGSTGTAYGTSGQILKSNGNASPTWVAASTVIGGPYLPLSAGSSYPLTGDLYLKTAANEGNLFFGTASASYKIFGGGTYGYMGYDTGGYHRFLTSGTERMRITPDSGSSFAIIKAQQGTYNSIAALSLYGTNPNANGGSVVSRSSILSQTDGTAFGANLIFKVNDTSNVEQERMRISSGGNVGIGVTNPGIKLQLISADEQLTNFSSSVADQLAYSQINANSSTSGTITAAAALELVGKANGSGHGRHAWIGAEGTPNTSTKTKLKFKIRGETASGYDWAGAAEAPTIMTLEGDGNVGIGTDDPEDRLEVSGGSLKIKTVASATLAPSIKLGRSDQANGNFENHISSQTGSGASQCKIEFKVCDTTATGRTTLLSLDGGNNRSIFQGYVGIGTTSPANKLDVKGAIGIQRTANTDTSNINMEGNFNFVAHSGYSHRFEQAGTEVARILPSGNVGIGTASPGSKLQVAGEIRAADGNKGTPSYTFTSDTNTGMYSDTADVIDFTAGGTKSLSVTTSGATVYGSALMPSNAAILLQNQNNNNQFYIRNSGVSDATFQVGQGAPGSNVRFFINGSGNVGIGNTASTASVKLEVTGNTLLKNSNGVGDLYLGNYATANHFRFHTNNANTYFDMNCGDIYWRQGTSTRYQFFPSTANMTVQGTITQNSDARIKENVVEISDCISKVQAMRGVYYNRTDFNTDVTKVGVIAQEVEAVLPELVLESPETGLKSVAYSELTSVLINAIKEQQEIIEDLKTRITQLEN